jgi:transcriptional regulator GlxA family with amidase domain
MPTTTNRVFFYLNNGTHILDLAGAVQVFHEATNYGIPYTIQYVSDMPNQTSSANLGFSNLAVFSETEILPTDILIVAGFRISCLNKENTALFDWLKQAYAVNATICSVCTGCFMLAEAGLLDGKECTTHWDFTDKLQKEYPKLKVLKNRLFVNTGNIYTSAGVTTGIDLALFLLEQRHGAKFSYQIARELVVYIRRDGTAPQDSIYLQNRQHLNSSIHEIQDWIIHHLDEKIKIEQLAERIYTSSRNLTRLFKTTTGITIGAYIDALRTEKAVQMLKENHKVDEVARACGFQSTNQLRSLLKKRLDVLPSQLVDLS